MPVGPLELLLLGGVLLFAGGARRIPALGRALGSALHGFRKESTGRDDGQLERVVRADPPAEAKPDDAPPRD